MVITLLQQSTFRRYAAIVLSPFFYFCCFRCVTVPLTVVINYVFCIYHNKITAVRHGTGVILLQFSSCWIINLMSSSGQFLWHQYSESVTRCCGTDRFDSVCQSYEANRCTCMIDSEGLRDTLLLLHMGYCYTATVLQHNDMNIVNECRQKNRNTLHDRPKFYNHAMKILSLCSQLRKQLKSHGLGTLALHVCSSELLGKIDVFIHI